MRWPRPAMDRPALVALALGLAGAAYRLVLVLLTIPGSNSDEATFGLAAMHIAENGDRPLFLYGQHYMGTVESYLAAPLFAVAGPGWPALRLPLVGLWAVFVYLVYRLSRRLYSPWLATVTVGLLSLGSERVVRDQLTAVGGRPEIKPAVVLLLLIAVGIGERRLRHRWLGYAVFGLLAGLSLWDDWLVLPYLAVCFLTLVVAAGRQLVGRAGLLVVAGFVVGLYPLILDNLRAPPGQDSLSVFQQLSDGESEPATLGQRLHGAIDIGIPLATGACPPDDCVPGQVWWGWLYLVLLVAGAVLAVVCLRRAVRPESRDRTVGGPADRTVGEAAPDRTAAGIRYVAQLALILGAALILAAYARNDLAGTAPQASARYLSILQISLPAVLWPLWLVGRRLRPTGTGLGTTEAGPPPGRTGGVPRVAGLVAAVALAALTAAMVWSTAALVGDIGTLRAEERAAHELADAVRTARIRYVYSGYWTCNRLVFNTREKVVCAVLGDDLTPGQNRYPPYPVMVDRAARPAFIFAAGSASDIAFQDHLRRHGVTATVTGVGAYRIYQPDRAVRPWQ